jgi:NADH:ubiquinone oxidoreductase subunit K
VDAEAKRMQDGFGNPSYEVSTSYRVTAARIIVMNLLTQPVGLSHYLVVGAVLFVCGVVCMATKRNLLGVLMGIELVLNGANLNFIAFASPLLRADGDNAIGLDGPMIALFVIVLAAAEAAVALAIALNYYHTHATVDVDQGEELKG